MSTAEQKTAATLSAGELIEEPVKAARRVISGLDGECRVPESLVDVVEALCIAVERLAHVIDNKQAPIPGVCRKRGCTQENGCENGCETALNNLVFVVDGVLRGELPVRKLREAFEALRIETRHD